MEDEYVGKICNYCSYEEVVVETPSTKQGSAQVGNEHRHANGNKVNEVSNLGGGQTISLGQTVSTPIPSFALYHGLKRTSSVFAVSVVPGGEAMERAFREVERDVRIGKLVIGRNESLAEKKDKDVLYCKMPKGIHEGKVYLMDAVMATGETLKSGIKKLNDLGVQTKNIVVVNMICSKEGVDRLFQSYPDITLITLAVDQAVSTLGHFCLPGVGDFEERYFGATTREMSDK